MNCRVWHHVSKITQQRKWQNGKWTGSRFWSTCFCQLWQSASHSLCLIGLTLHTVSVLDNCDDALKWGQGADRIGWRQRGVMESTVWLGLDEEWWFMISFSVAWAPFLPCPRVLSDFELRGSAVCLVLGRGMRSDSFHVPLDVWRIWKALLSYLDRVRISNSAN